MTESCLYNVYCDEGCHLEHDRIPVMAMGAVTCAHGQVQDIAQQIRALKITHGLKPGFEAKWTKVSPAKASFYSKLIDFFLDDERLRFRGLLVPNKGLLDHARFDQSHEDWFCKMYFTMLHQIFTAPHRYRIYLDVRDTRGGPKVRNLHDVLVSNLSGFDRQTIEHVEQVRSHEVELLQITDLLIGALTYANRSLNTSSAKGAIVKRLRDGFGQHALSRTSAFATTKFNIRVWHAQEAAG